MKVLGWVALAWACLWVPSAAAQESYINKPTELAPSPVYLTRPVEGQVEVTNLPPVQDVRITSGTLEGPVEVQGEVGIRTQGPLPVEVSNPLQFPEALRVDGPVQVDDTQPLRVWVENLPETSTVSPPMTARTFVAYYFKAAFSAKDGRVRRAFRAPAGAVFHLTDLTLDSRPDVNLRVRVVAAAADVDGGVAGAAGADELPLALVDTRTAPSTRLSTPVPLSGEFALEVEALGPGQGAPFSAVATGFATPAPGPATPGPTPSPPPTPAE